MAESPKKEASPAGGKTDRIKNLEAYRAGIEKKYGSGSIFAGNDDVIFDIEPIPSGDYGLDMALGIGGVPRGRIVELYGNESSGKTTLALSFARSVSTAGGYTMFVDAEHAINMGFVEDMGIDLDKFYFSQPDFGEQGLDEVIDAVKSGVFDLVIVDSVSALVPKAELEGEMEDMRVGELARMMSKAMRKVAGVANRTGTCVIFINQIREKIGVMFGNPETTTGGRALKFFSSQRLECRRADIIKGKGKDTDAVGIMTKVKVVKNKVAPPFRTAEITIVFGQNGEYGVSRTASIFAAGLELGLIENTSGSWYQAVGAEGRANGKEGMKALIFEDKALQSFLESGIQAEMVKRTSRKKRLEEGSAADAAAALAAELADVPEDPYGDLEGDFIKPEDLG